MTIISPTDFPGCAAYGFRSVTQTTRDNCVHVVVLTPLPVSLDNQNLQPIECLSILFSTHL